MYRSLVFASIVALAFAATAVNRCGNQQPFPTFVDILGCDEQPCLVVKGTSGRFHLEFVVDREIKNLTTNVLAKVLGTSVNYPVPDEQKFSCDHLLYKSYCPLHRGEDVGYIFEMFIGTFYPEIALTIEISLNDENDRVVTCFSTAIKVVREQ